MNEKSHHRFGGRALVVGSAAFLAAVMPAACSGGAPQIEDGKIGGISCTSTAECPAGQICGSNGRCSASGTGSGGTTATGGNSATGGSGIVVPPSGGSGGSDGGSPPPDAACGADIQQAMLVPVNMFVMFDRSGSMNDEADETTGASRWDLASAALTMFFQDPTASGLGVALRFFPHDSPAVGCTGGDNGVCDAAACSQPLVPLMAPATIALPTLSAEAAPTDMHEESLVTAIMSSAPAPSGMGGGMMSGGTPIFAALDGALRWATAYQTAHPYPAQQTVVVFVTDGEPNGCEDDFDLISDLAAQAFASAGVTTYTIGLTGSNEADMEQVAQAGNGDSFFVDDGPTAAQDLVAALQAIQGAALDCDFAIPTPTDGGMADPGQVNVQYTSMMGGAPVSFTRVGSAADCGVSQSWYYDDPAAPTRIHLCPDVCDTVRANPTAGISIAIGCATIVEPPR
jgi:hypothetical protein